MKQELLDYFSVDEDIKKEELKKIYKKMCLKYHPDHGGSDQDFNTLNNNYNTLVNLLFNKTHDDNIFENFRYESSVFNTLYTYCLNTNYTIDEYREYVEKNIAKLLPLLTLDCITIDEYNMIAYFLTFKANLEVDYVLDIITKAQTKASISKVYAHDLTLSIIDKDILEILFDLNYNKTKENTNNTSDKTNTSYNKESFIDRYETQIVIILIVIIIIILTALFNINNSQTNYSSYSSNNAVRYEPKKDYKEFLLNNGYTYNNEDDYYYKQTNPSYFDYIAFGLNNNNSDIEYIMLAFEYYVPLTDDLYQTMIAVSNTKEICTIYMYQEEYDCQIENQDIPLLMEVEIMKLNEFAES